MEGQAFSARRPPPGRDDTAAPPSLGADRDPDDRPAVKVAAWSATVLGATMGLLLAALAGGGLLLNQPAAQAVAPSSHALSDIPPEYLALYRESAAACRGLSWTILAAIGSIEADHGRSSLPGVRAGANEAGAMGPMQFMPATWEAYGVDGDKDGDRDVYDPHDAVPGAANYLCANGAGNAERLRSAIWNHNHSDQYVQEVLDLAGRYGTAETLLGNGTGGACPVPGGDVADNWGDPRSGGRTHKGNDIGAPEGAPVVAVFDGNIFNVENEDVGLGGIGLWLRSDAGDAYYYAHNSSNAVSEGQRVSKGELIGYVGHTGNADATYPHVHFQVHPGGGDPTDPYPILTSWGCARTGASR